MDASPRNYIDATQVGKILGCSRVTVWRRSRIGQIPVAMYTLGGQARFDRDVIEALAETLRAGPVPAASTTPAA